MASCRVPSSPVANANAYLPAVFTRFEGTELYNYSPLIFALNQVPDMMRGAGVRLQRYKDGNLSDVITFDSKEGLTWLDSAGRSFVMTTKELSDWRGNRSDAGRLAPKGFPKSNHFGKTIS